MSAAIMEAFCDGRTTFPCDSNTITAVSVGIGAGGVALLFVGFLLNKVRCCCQEKGHRDWMLCSAQESRLWLFSFLF